MEQLLINNTDFDKFNIEIEGKLKLGWEKKGKFLIYKINNVVNYSQCLVKMEYSFIEYSEIKQLLASWNVF